MPSRSRPEWLGPETDDITPAVSTSSHAFQAILDDLVRTVDLPMPSMDPVAPAAAPSASIGLDDVTPAGLPSPAEADDAALVGPPPARLQGKGDLTLVIGFGPDAREAARILADGVSGDVRPVADRRDALAARADGVRRGCAVVAPVELDAVDAVPALAARLAALAPDQVWVAVDVSRRPEDTLRWVAQVDAVLAVDAIAATGARRTAGSHGLASLARPLLWLETREG
ncbi:hypothetical protein LLS1_02610 [Leifsonia sp. LS1]|uniref:hypothetical protein n=1 Tax=Leifsonia sp. LS1 TaxID=2828483 RepID=UPI001CFE48E1|nr:hypothetical protein [Leifsonia sp. LS1]GIT78592.1 hypothetical protein LLS1_02610 [Leifsonia sp. LS1]